MFLPKQIEIEAGGNRTIFFGEAFDLEGNNVWLDSMTLINDVGGKFSEWVELEEGESLDSNLVHITVPSEEEQEDVVGQ